MCIQVGRGPGPRALGGYAVLTPHSDVTPYLEQDGVDLLDGLGLTQREGLAVQRTAAHPRCEGLTQAVEAEQVVAGRLHRLEDHVGAYGADELRGNRGAVDEERVGDAHGRGIGIVQGRIPRVRG